MVESYCTEWIHCDLFIYSLMMGFGLFPILTFVNSAAVNRHEHAVFELVFLAGKYDVTLNKSLYLLLEKMVIRTSSYPVEERTKNLKVLSQPRNSPPVLVTIVFLKRQVMQ